MSFLQPLLLAALPVILLPIIIHLINQRRYQTLRWGAMMFLLAANRMSRGYARLRQWLILLFRVLALAGLVFAISRPLASGWLGMAAGAGADTTLVLLDRSPSMQQERRGAVGSKLETGRQQLVRTLNMLRSARWVLIDSATCVPREMESPSALLDLPAAEPTSVSADLPAMLQAAQDYIQRNKPGRVEVWICSDMRQNDWNAEDGRWQALRDAFAGSSQGIRIHLLAYPEVAPDNVAVRITGVRRRQAGDSSDLLVSLRLTREETAAAPRLAMGTEDNASARPSERLSVPIRFEIEGARSEVAVEMTGPELELKDQRIPLDRNRQRGWGKVSIPSDANPADNEHYFAYDQPAERRTVIVTEDVQGAQPLQLASTISPDPELLQCTSETLAPEQLSSVAWESASLLLWQGPLPGGEAAHSVLEFVDRGGDAIFLPPRAPTSDELLGLRWQSWTESSEALGVASWRGDQDLLAHTQSGSALPLGALQVHRYCGIYGEHTPLATLKSGATLLGRATTPRGGAYFLSTTAAPEDSSLAAGGVVLYVLVQRAIAASAATLGKTRQVVAGDATLKVDTPPEGWRQLTGPSNAVSADTGLYAGVYAAGEKLIAINAADAEVQAAVLPDRRVAELFQGLDFSRVDDTAGSLAALIDEIWRPFLVAMILALIAEAALCLPRITPRTEAAGAQP